MSDSRWTDVWASVTKEADFVYVDLFLVFRLEVSGRVVEARFSKRQLDDIVGLNIHKLIFEQLITQMEALCILHSR